MQQEENEHCCKDDGQMFNHVTVSLSYLSLSPYAQTLVVVQGCWKRVTQASLGWLTPGLPQASQLTEA